MKKRIIHQVTFMITTQCNSKCKHCDLWKTPVTTVKVEDFKNKLKELKEEYNILGVCLIGGEICTLPNLKEYTDVCHDLGYEVSAPINGTMPEHMNKLVRDCEIAVVCLSIDGIDGSHEKQRGVPVEHPLKTIELLKGFKTPIIIPTITKLNYKEIPALVKLGEKTGAGAEFSLYRQDDYFKNDLKEDLLLNKEERLEVISLLKSSNAIYYMSNWALWRFMQGKSYPHDEEGALFFDENLNRIRIPKGSYEPVTTRAGFTKNPLWKWKWRLDCFLIGVFKKQRKMYPDSNYPTLQKRIIRRLKK